VTDRPVTPFGHIILTPIQPVFALLLLLLPNNDLLQQFEDYVIELRCEKGRRKEKRTKYNKLKKYVQSRE
jgi:hypothetical protein